jgi:predicted transcriptional regulator
MMTASERKNNRGKIQIMGDILALATSGVKKTHIMYRANLSYEQLYLYLRAYLKEADRTGCIFRWGII